jgi:hypothetical protein
MGADAIQGLLGVIPGGGIAALAIWALIKKDAQCTALAARLTDIASASAVSNTEVKAAIDGLRDVIRTGTRR